MSQPLECGTFCGPENPPCGEGNRSEPRRSVSPSPLKPDVEPSRASSSRRQGNGIDSKMMVNIQQQKPWQYHHYVYQGRTLQICRKSPQAGTREGESAQRRALGTGIRHLQRAEPCVEVEPIWRNKTVRGAENLQIYEMYLANAFYNSRVFSFPDLLIRESCRPFQCRALLRSLHRCNQPGRWQIISGREPKDLKICCFFFRLDLAIPM